MPTLVNVNVHESQFPEIVQEQLKRSLRTRQIQHKFHYQSYRQAEKWHALHRAFAPSAKDAGPGAIYEAAFQRLAEDIRPTQILGLCCGYGEKEVRLLEALKGSALFVASDASLPMVLHGAAAAGRVVGAENCQRLICDLESAGDLPECSPALASKEARRCFTCFGSVHNFEPELIFSRLASLLQPQDVLLFSANLAGEVSSAELISKNILPQYENELTFDWLFQFLSDLGLSSEDGVMQGKVESSPVDPDLWRIALYYVLAADRSIRLEGERFDFRAGESLRLFYSYRYTPQKISEWLSRAQLNCVQQWVSPCEGVFLCARR
jgi:L-histidine Nalpha-methyltransferase